MFCMLYTTKENDCPMIFFFSIENMPSVIVLGNHNSSGDVYKEEMRIII